MNSPDQDTIAQLKDDIDSGRTGDKVAAGDPGLSPLGTDDEAGGNSPSPKQINLARRQEAAIGAAAGQADHPSKGMGSILIVGAVFVVMAIVVVTSFWMRMGGQP